MRFCRFIFLAIFLIGLPLQAYADETGKDKTGTNPINFSNDLRMYYNL